MRPFRAISSCLRNYATFEGRAPRSEFWWFALFLAVLEFVGQNSTNLLASSFRIKFGLNFGLGAEFSWWTNLLTAIFFLPFTAVLSRRTHDIGIPASRILVIPFVLLACASLLLKAFPYAQTQNAVLVIGLSLLFGAFLYATLKKSQPGPNSYGPNPHEVSP